MQRIVLIGQAPGPNTDPDLPLFPVPKTSAGGRLVQIAGITKGQYLATFERINVLRYFPGKWQNGDRFPLQEARVAADAIAPLLAGRRVVLVGQNVALAFSIRQDFFVWSTHQVRRRCPVTRDPGLAEFAVIPHPSGRNFWYNAAARRAEARAFFDRLLGRESTVSTAT